MPELPEVETMVRGVRPLLVGSRLVDVTLCECACKPISFQPPLSVVQEMAIGQHVDSVTRRGKRIVLSLANGSAFIVEPRMTGLMLVSDPPDPEHLRVRWTIRTGRRNADVWFWDRRGLGTVRWLNPLDLAAALGPETLGPDALEFTPDLWFRQLASTSRPIKVALLDQKLVAGIGNLYASEILHRAGIHPADPSSAISSRRLARLHQATDDILTEAIRYEGSTLGDGTYRNALNQDGNYQRHHRVYAREGELCVTCGKSRIARIVQAQRSTFFCPRCQRPTRGSKQ